jgi:hypothetical protein
MLPSDLSRALVTPWVLVAFAVLGISTVIFLCASVLSFKRRHSVPGRRLIQTKRLAIIGIVFSMTVSALIAYQAARQIESDREYRSIHALFSVHVAINGMVTTTRVSEPQTFRTSSGQYNVGCGDSRQAVVTWKVPDGAFDITANASWQNTNNVRHLEQHLGETQNVSEITATGFMVGLERNLFAGCPGGGHGEFVLSGTYRIRSSEVHGQQVLKTLDDKVNREQPLAVLIPHDEGTKPESCDISIESENKRDSVHFPIIGHQDGSFTFSTGVVELSFGTQIPAQVSITVDRLLLRVQ